MNRRAACLDIIFESIDVLYVSLGMTDKQDAVYVLPCIIFTLFITMNEENQERGRKKKKKNLNKVKSGSAADQSRLRHPSLPSVHDSLSFFLFFFFFFFFFVLIIVSL